MSRKNHDPAIIQGFRELVKVLKDSGDRSELDAVADAQQTAIAYYYDILKTMALRRMGSPEGDVLPDTEPMREAAAVINRVCVSQNMDPLFIGDPDNATDLFAFSSGLSVLRKS